MILACLILVFAAEDGVTLSAAEARAGVFADADTRQVFRVAAPAGFRGRAEWTATLNRRILARGSAPVAGPGPLEIKFRAPHVNPGVVPAVELAVAVYATGADAPTASTTWTLHVFPSDPFADRAAFLKRLDIQLFDPEGATADRFTKAGIPFEHTRNPAVIKLPRAGLLVLGEGVSVRDFRDLPELAIAAAAAGRRVLWLAPAPLGSFALPGSAGGGPEAVSLRLRRTDIISEFDKRLDRQWAAAPAGLVLRGEGEAVHAEVSAGKGWPWMEIEFAGEGRLVVCGFAIVKHWDAGPAPRWFAARLLEHMSPTVGPQAPSKGRAQP